jgi:serine/threonine protein phosphatase PrpC
VASQPAAGEKISGDRHVVVRHRRGVLVGVIDGCGHGPEAAHAAGRAVAVLQQEPESPVLFHLHRCHAALADTRGVAMTLADFNFREQTVTLCGVGNVEALLYRGHATPGSPPQETALLRAGIVGLELPEPYASVFGLQAGDMLILASDGVDTTFGPDLTLRSDPQRLAERLLAQHHKAQDDALVLVTRFRHDDDD